MVEWHTQQQGRCWSAGVGGPITGKGANCLLIDDPFKNDEEAYSLLRRDKVWEWYQHTFYTRLEPDGAIVIVLTRWHDDDLAGRILNEEKTGENPEHWHILNFAALKETTTQKFPESCTVAPDWRETGEALCRERFPEDRLLVIKSKIGERAWRALYQQNPIAEEGNIWKLTWFKPYDDSFIVDNEIELFNDGWDWDTAYGDEKNERNAANAGVRASIGSDGNIYVSDCEFQWCEFPQQIKRMKEKESPHYVEAKASGKSIVQSLQKAGIFAHEVKIKGGDKISRTILSTPVAEQGKVFIHRKIWDKLLFDERQGILGFPARPFKDLNDAFVQMLNRLWPYTQDEPQEEKVPEDWRDFINTESDKQLAEKRYKPNLT
jgi:phage terminase large subunit-like protein